MIGQTKFHILIADGDSEDQEILMEALSEQQPETRITFVWNGQEALSYLSACPEDGLPDSIILDYKMPILNSAKVLYKLNHRMPAER